MHSLLSVPNPTPLFRLSMLAVEAVMSHWDGFGGHTFQQYDWQQRRFVDGRGKNGNNFFVFHYGSKFGIIPTGRLRFTLSCQTHIYHIHEYTQCLSIHVYVYVCHIQKHTMCVACM
jgi:hypothetical protein